jgi:hypothetical protein
MISLTSGIPTNNNLNPVEAETKINIMGDIWRQAAAGVKADAELTITTTTTTTTKGGETLKNGRNPRREAS